MSERPAINNRTNELKTIKMSYRLEGAYSPYKYIQIELDGTGEGTLSYELYRERVGKDGKKNDAVKFKADEGTIKKLVGLYTKADFFKLEVNDLNKDEIQVTDVGTTTLTYNYEGKERKLSYGYVENNPLEGLVRIYSRLAKEHLPDRQRNR